MQLQIPLLLLFRYYVLFMSLSFLKLSGLVVPIHVNLMKLRLGSFPQIFVITEHVKLSLAYQI